MPAHHRIQTLIQTAQAVFAKSTSSPSSSSSSSSSTSSSSSSSSTQPRRQRLVSAESQQPGGLKGLIELVNGMTAQDLGLDRSASLQSPISLASSRTRAQSSGAPITYIDIFEDPTVSIGIFIIHTGQCIPLHNHPEMTGILKCLHGQMDLISYTNLSGEDLNRVKVPADLDPESRLLIRQGLVFPTRREIIRGISPQSPPCCLSPVEGNYHELYSVGGPAAFLDILSPPYSQTNGSPHSDDDEDDEEESRRDCNFFDVLIRGPLAEQDPSISWLQYMDAPPDYFCDREEYLGPPLSL